MTARIIVRDELRRGAYLAVYVPWPAIEVPELCETTITLLCAEIGAVLRTMADPDQARAAVGDVGEEAA